MGGEEDLGAGGVDVRALEHRDESRRECGMKAGVQFVNDEEVSPTDRYGSWLIGGRCGVREVER